MVFFQLSDLGCTLQHAQLRDGVRNLLQLVPPYTHTVSRLRWFFDRHKKVESVVCNALNTTVNSLFFTESPTEVLYNLEVNSLKRLWSFGTFTESSSICKMISVSGYV